MGPDTTKILAGIAGGGAAGLSLAWFGTTSATAPTTATAPLNTFQDAGYCATQGLTVANAVQTTPVNAYGTLSPVRVLIQSQTITFHVAFLEASTPALEVYNRVALGSLVPSSGAFSVTTTASPTRQLYSAVFDVVDGSNHLRAYVPNCEVTDVDDLQIQNGQPIEYGVTVTAYPNAAGTVVKWFYVVASDVS